jgi:aldose 1-epimerase
MHAPIVLEHGGTQVEVAVDAGGRIAQMRADGQPLLIDPGSDPTSTGWGSFPMAPWAGRIRHGRFRFLDVDHRIVANHQDGSDDDPARRHAIHGTVFARRWTVVDVAPTSIAMTCDLTGSLDWPFAGTAHQQIRAEANAVHCELSVEATETSFPAEIGWHPWFRKPERVDFAPLAMYRRDALGLPTGELVNPRAGPWDDCFVNIEPVTLHYARAAAAKVTVSSDCDHWVIYDEPPGATCVEPQSGPPDAVTIRPRLTVPGDPLRRTLTVSW